MRAPMPPKDIIVVNTEDKEIRLFLERLIVAGSLTVELDTEQFVVAIHREKFSEAGRGILISGGPDGLE